MTSGYGQGMVFGSLMDGLDTLVLPGSQQTRLGQAALYGQLSVIRLRMCSQ